MVPHQERPLRRLAACLTIFSLVGAASLDAQIRTTQPRPTRGTPIVRSPQQGLTLLPPAPAPTGLQASAAAPARVTLAWQPVAGATGYTVSRAVKGRKAVVLTSTPVTATSYTDEGAGPSLDLVYSVAAHVPDRSPGVASVATRTPSGGHVLQLEAKARGPGEVVLTWIAAPGADRYEITGTSMPAGAVTIPAGESHVVAGVAPGPQKFMVIAVYDVGGDDYEADVNLAPAAAVTVCCRSAKYRITINGFKAYAETWDHALEVDGARDEVYVAADVVFVDSTAAGRITVPSYVRSKEYGAIGPTLHNPAASWPNRVQAGHATDRGGVQSSDAYPEPSPWVEVAKPADPERLPLEVFCGTLAEGRNAVVVAPSIWEYDGGTSSFGDWVTWGSKVATMLLASNLYTGVVGASGTAITAGAQLALGVAATADSAGIIGNAQDRPIGMRKRRQQSASDRPSFEFVPQSLVFTYATAETMLGISEGGLPRGIVTRRFPDDPYLRGDYALFIQVQRFTGKCPGEP